MVAVCCLVEADAACPNDGMTLQQRLNNALPGDVIEFCGEELPVKTVKSGLPTAPITIRGGDERAIIKGSLQSGYCLSVTHDWYVFENFDVMNCKKGFVATAASHGILRGVTVQDTYEESYKFREASQYWLVESCTSRNAGLRGIYGEGFYVGQASSNWISNIPDGSAYITFKDCTADDNANDGFDVKEGMISYGSCLLHLKYNEN